MPETIGHLSSKNPEISEFSVEGGWESERTSAAYLHSDQILSGGPEALRLLAPQRGLIAIVKSQNHAPSTISSTHQGSGTALPCPPAACIKPCILPELSNFYCLP